jgi:hypothetical protein
MGIFKTVFRTLMTRLFAAIYAYSMSNGSSYAETQLFYPSLYCEVPA